MAHVETQTESNHGPDLTSQRTGHTNRASRVDVAAREIVLLEELEALLASGRVGRAQARIAERREMLQVYLRSAAQPLKPISTPQEPRSLVERLNDLQTQGAHE